jgi:hypothetical protein
MAVIETIDMKLKNVLCPPIILVILETWNIFGNVVNISTSIMMNNCQISSAIHVFLLKEPELQLHTT